MLKTVEPNTILTDNTQQNRPQIPESSYSVLFTENIPNPSVELHQQFSEVFPSEQTQFEIEPWRLQHQRWFEAANQFLRKQKPERNYMIQQLTLLDTKINLIKFP